MFFFIVVILAMIGKILRIQFSMFDVNVKEGMSGTDKTKEGLESSCIDTSKSVNEITETITKKVASITSNIKSTNRREMENLITSYHDLLSVWAISDLMTTDATNNDCITKMVTKLALYGNAGKSLESSLHWLDEQPH